MTDKPDYMQKVRDDLGAGGNPVAVLLLAHTLEALDTERESSIGWASQFRREVESHEETKAELQALRERVAQICKNWVMTPGAEILESLRSLLPAPDPLVQAVKECGYATLDQIEPEFAADLRAALTRHGLTISAIGGKQ